MVLNHWSSVVNVGITLSVIATLLFFTFSILRDILSVLSSINKNLDDINKELDILGDNLRTYIRGKIK